MMNDIDDLKRAAVAYSQIVDAENLSTGVLRARTKLEQAARAYAASLADFGPGLDPAPPPITAEALAREVLEAARGATARPWRTLERKDEKDWLVLFPDGEDVSILGAADATFIAAACNAAETLSRAYLEAVGRERALEALLHEAERFESRRGEGDDTEHARGNWLARTRAALKG